MKKLAIISIFVYDSISVLEAYAATLCSFIIIENVSFGYQYIGSEDIDNNLCRAFDILFDETLKRLKSEGIRLLSIDI